MSLRVPSCVIAGVVAKPRGFCVSLPPHLASAGGAGFGSGDTVHVADGSGRQARGWDDVIVVSCHGLARLVLDASRRRAACESARKLYPGRPSVAPSCVRQTQLPLGTSFGRELRRGVAHRAGYGRVVAVCITSAGLA